jgi:uncharacterized protein (TIGR00730 family)
MVKSIAVFCGSEPGNSPLYLQAARDIGKTFAQKGIRIIYGGGNVGMMGALAGATLENGGTIIGVIPQALKVKELAKYDLTELIVVNSMHERKALMADKSDAFVALPGGYGTFEEFCEIVTWAKLGMHAKPCVLLNINGFFDHLIALFDHAQQEGFMTKTFRSLVLVENDISSLLDTVINYHPPKMEEWISRSQT